jgi:predicted transcriptional regulator
VTSKIASAILHNIQNTISFTTRDVQGFFPAVPFGILKDSIKELVEEKKVFVYGVKRGTYYSTNPNLQEGEKDDELNPALIKVVEQFILSRKEFSSSDLFAALPNYQEHILRKVLIFLRDDKGILHLHGHGKSSIWSQHSELPEDPPVNEEINMELRSKILDFAKSNARWFKRSELDDLFEASAYEIRQTLYGLMDDGEIQMRGERRSTEYAYCEVTDEIPENEDEETKADQELKLKVLELINELKVVTVPQLIEKLNKARSDIVLALRELEENGEIYHEGIKKSSRYIHKDVPVTKADTIIKEIREEKKEEKLLEKPINELSALLRVNSAVYIIFINNTQMYELRTVNILAGGTKTLLASKNAEEVTEHLFTLTKGVAVELTV